VSARQVPRTASSCAGEAPKVVSHVLDAVAKRCPAGPVPVIVFAFAAGFAPPARIVPPEIVFVVLDVVAAAISSLLCHCGSHGWLSEVRHCRPVGPLPAVSF
jgi:hypothetical protein